MLVKTIYMHFGIIGIYFFMLIGSMIAYFVLSGISYAYFFILKRNKYHPRYKAEPSIIICSKKWAIISAVGISALVIPIELIIINDNSRIYYDVADYGWPYLLLSMVVVLVIAETLIYWIHRGLHTDFFYRHLHVYHHQFREPTPFVSVAFHPLDAFFQAVPYHLCALVLPIHVGVYHGFIMLAMFWAVMIHDRVRLVPSEWINHTGCHMVHHWYYGYNYGQDNNQ